jgi:hypothetical protein
MAYGSLTWVKIKYKEVIRAEFQFYTLSQAHNRLENIYPRGSCREE